MGFKMVIVPPNTQPDWPQKIRAAVPDCEVQMFGSAEAAMDAIVDADAAYGNITPELLRHTNCAGSRHPLRPRQPATTTRNSSRVTWS